MPILIGTGSNQVPTNGDLGTMAFQDSAAISVGIANVSGNVAIGGITTLTANVILGSSGLSANGGFGTAGQLLNSNGTATYWAADRSANAYTNAVAYVDGKSYVNTAQLSSNLANYQTTAGLAANVATLAANSSNSSTYANASISNVFTVGTSTYFVVGGNVGIGNTAPDAKLTVTGTANISGNVVIGGITTHNANVILGSSGLSANGGFGTAGQVLSSNGTATYWSTVSGGGGDAAAAYTNAVAYVDGKSYVNTSQLSSNLANYQTTAGLASNVAVLTANSSTFLGTANLNNIETFITSNASAAYTNAVAYVDGKSYVNTAQLSSNLANYQTTAGLSANVATLTANNATNLDGVPAASYVNTSGSYTITGMLTYSNGITFSNTITANGSNGTAGQVLTSSGDTGNVYWATASGGGGITTGKAIAMALIFG
jgi:hypothetical protein